MTTKLYNSAKINELHYIDDRKLFESVTSPVIQEIGNILVESELHNKYGIALLHNH